MAENTGAGRILEILLVEDSDSDALLTRKALATAKIANRIALAKDGETALATLRRQGAYANAIVPDLVLLDLSLPAKGGKDVLREIRADETLKRLPVVILTGSHAEADVNQAYELYANGYLVKPVNAEKFTDLVRTLIWNRNITLKT